MANTKPMAEALALIDDPERFGQMLELWRVELGWSFGRLAREAGLVDASGNVRRDQAYRACRGTDVLGSNRAKLCKAIQRGLEAH